MRGLLLIVVLAVAVNAKTIQDDDFEDEQNEVAGGYDNTVKDPCAVKDCGLGKECDLDENNKAICVCTRRCTEEIDPRARVCSTTNKTFSSECELYRQKCLCKRNQPGCADPENRRGHLDYFGDCKDIAPCKPEEMEEYPTRMREWLFFVMEELAKREDLQGEALRLAKETKTRTDRHWVIPVIWKFCDLDKSADKSISHREMLPISAPLKPLEHCTGPFLEDHCDTDNSGDITLVEWAHCLGLDDEDVEDMEDICESIRQ